MIIGQHSVLISGPLAIPMALPWAVVSSLKPIRSGRLYFLRGIPPLRDKCFDVYETIRDNNIGDDAQPPRHLGDLYRCFGFRDLPLGRYPGTFGLDDRLWC